MNEQTVLSFRIIEAYNRHVDLVAPLFDAYRVFYGRKPDLERSTQFLAERIGIRDTVVFIAVPGEEGDEEEYSEGLGFAILYPTFNSVLAASMWVLNDLYVAERFRRCRIASALVERGRKLVVDTGAKRISLETGVDNTPSHALYESLGFRRNDDFRTFFSDV